MTSVEEPPGSTPRPRRVDAARNEQTLLDAAAAVFVSSGVDAPVRAVAAKAGVGMGTVYRHFPTRADLIVAVYRHQVDACAQAGPVLLSESTSPQVALQRWVELFVDFLVTKHGLAGALQNDAADFDALHTYFVDRLVPVCASLLEAATHSSHLERPISAYELMRGIGNLCVGASRDPRYDPRRLVQALVSGVLGGSA